MSVIDNRPSVVELKAYGGDILTLRINVNGADYSTATWTGQIRQDHDAPVDAVFTITPDSTGANVVLPPEQTEILLGITPMAREAPSFGTFATTGVMRYSGVWDIQVSAPTMVKTLVQGLIEVYADVTRLP